MDCCLTGSLLLQINWLIDWLIAIQSEHDNQARGSLIVAQKTRPSISLSTLQQKYYDNTAIINHIQKSFSFFFVSKARYLIKHNRCGGSLAPAQIVKVSPPDEWCLTLLLFNVAGSIGQPADLHHRNKNRPVICDLHRPVTSSSTSSCSSVLLCL